MKYLLTGHDAKRTSKAGKNYITLHLERQTPFLQFKALHFFDGEFNYDIGTWIELDVTEKDGQFFANKPKEKKSWSGSKAITFDEQKRLTAMTCAVELIVSGRVEMKDLSAIKKRIEELI
jgi:hypothetical protein